MAERPKSAAVRPRTTAQSVKKEQWSSNREATMDLMEKDELEFHMTFPTPSPFSHADSSSLAQDDIEPVVFILGWEDCTDEDLCVYSDMYEAKGCITVRYTAPLSYLAWDRERLRMVASRLVGLIPEMCLTESPVIVHAFGDNGSNVYQFLREELNSNGMESAITATIFDSGPNKFSMETITKSIFADSESSWLYRSGLLFLTIGQLVIQLVSTWLGNMVESAVSQLILPSPWQYVKSETFPPAMFICNAKSLEVIEAAVKRKKAGGLVNIESYDDSESYRHLDVQKEKYCQAVMGFLHECMADRTSDPESEEDTHHVDTEDDDWEKTK